VNDDVIVHVRPADDTTSVLSVTMLDAIAVRDDGSPDVDAIDYSRERGPFWLVFVNKVALDPEHPLPEQRVDAAFHRAVREHPGQEIGVAPCTPEDLANAGIHRIPVPPDSPEGRFLVPGEGQ
jgi:hypothetical protein